MGATTRGGGTGITLTTPVTREHPLGTPTGASSFTVTQAKTHFSLWAMMAAPLIVGADIPNMAQQNLDIITNQEVIAVDQDTLGIQAFTVSSANSRWVLTRPLANGDTAVAFFNAATTPWTFATSDFASLGLDPAQTYLAKDLWTKETTKATEPLIARRPWPATRRMQRLTTRGPSIAVPTERVTANATQATGVAVSYLATGKDAFDGALAPGLLERRPGRTSRSARRRSAAR